MTEESSRPNKYLIWAYLGGVLVVSLLILKVIMWMDGAK
jgi:hypothetical protein